MRADPDSEWRGLHARGVAEATAALENRGLSVDALALPTSTARELSTRLAFASDPSAESVEYLVVHTRVTSPTRSLVGAASIPRARGVLARVLAADDGAALAVTGAAHPRNGEVARVSDLVALLSWDATRALARALDEARVESWVRDAFSLPEVARSEDLAVAARVLADVTAGAPVAWVLRHHGVTP